MIAPGATYSTAFSPAQASELCAIAERAGVSVSAVIETSWHLGKQRIYDLTLLVDDTAPPPLETMPA